MAVETIQNAGLNVFLLSTQPLHLLKILRAFGIMSYWNAFQILIHHKNMVKCLRSALSIIACVSETKGELIIICQCSLRSPILL